MIKLFVIYGGKQEFAQWDLDQMVTNPCMKEGDEVVFRACGKAYETTAFVKNGEVVADVPNFLLRKAGKITVDLGWGLDVHMDCRTVFNVTAQEKPEGYACECNIKERAVDGSPDWNAAEGEPGHVLNRTHYKEWQEMFAEAEIDATASVEHPVNFLPDVGTKCEVVYNGIAYNCVLGKAEGDGVTGYYLGNFALMSGTGDTGEPFVIAMDGDGAALTLMCIDLTGAETATVSIKGQITKRIDKEYLPNATPFYVDVVKDGSAYTTEVTLSEMLEAINEGMKLVVRWVVEASGGNPSITYLHYLTAEWSTGAGGYAWSFGSGHNFNIISAPNSEELTVTYASS